MTTGFIAIACRLPRFLDYARNDNKVLSQEDYCHLDWSETKWRDLGNQHQTAHGNVVVKIM